MERESNWREKVVLAYIQEPPFGASDQHGCATGADVELAGKVLRDIGVETIEYVLTTFAELLPGVATGRWDINVPLFMTAKRAELVAFSLPVWALNDGFLVRAGNPKHLTSYEALARRNDARLSIVTGQVQHDAARRAGVPESRIRQFDVQQQAIDALFDGHIDAYASTSLGNRTLVQSIGDMRLASVAHEPSQQTKYAPPKGAYSFSKANPNLRGEFDRQLRQCLGSPDHRVLMGRYGFTEAEIDPVFGGLAARAR
jgi:polar amino acid transport system substrate-binding protein